MEKDKKKIIVGAGILGGAGLAYLLTRPHIPPTPPAYTCPCCGAKFPTQAELQAHMATCCAEPPPTEFGQVQGQVFDALTNSQILVGKIYVDDKFDCDIGPSGSYRTSNISYGTHTIKAEADNYQASSITVTLESSLMTHIDFFLSKLPEAPTEWTEGTVVTSIAVNPPTVFLGEVANIDVYIQGPYPAEYPLEIFGTVMVNGDSVTQSFTITHRNPTLRFSYTPTRTGSFTVRSQDKSATFTVMSGETGQFYSPFGGSRWPVCTKWRCAQPIHAFGFTDEALYDVLPTDQVEDMGQMFSTSPVYGQFQLWRSISGVEYPEEMGFLTGGQPLEWEPPGEIRESDAVNRGWDINEIGDYGITVIIAPKTTYSMISYWESKNALAKAIGRACLRNSFECTGIIANEKNIVYGHQQIYRNVEPYDYILCPYCKQQLRNYDAPYQQFRDSGDIILGRKLLEHIESAHPDHPLTEPAWF